MEKLQISRKIWLRGEGADESYLLREKDKKMCCVGIYLSSVIGMTDQELLGYSIVPEVPYDSSNEELTSLGFDNRSRFEELYGLNDDYFEVVEDERERLIAKGFRELTVRPVEVEFVD